MLIMTNSKPGPFAERVAAQRRRLQLSQREVSSRSGLDQGTISRIERGAMPNPTARTVEALAKALEVDVPDLFPSNDRESHVESRLERDEPPITKATREMIAAYFEGRGKALPDNVKKALVSAVGRVGDPKDERDLDDMARIIERGFEIRAKEAPFLDDDE